jgi:hypothetical protein
MPQRQDQRAARAHQARKPRHGVAALRCVQMHEDRSQHDQVEARLARGELCEIGQAVVEPFDLLRRMQLRGFGAQLPQRLDGDDLMAHGGELRRVPSGPCADIQHRAGRLRHQVQHLCVQSCKADALDGGRKPLGAFGVACGAAHMGHAELLAASGPASRIGTTPTRIPLIFFPSLFSGWEWRANGLG